jgi:2,4-dienoyl-CoA reductase-like NADH-dependent reductase (Old Yellow Enzyme family)/thioredoxin reductase
MSDQYPLLLSPIKIGGVTFRNRIFAAPTGVHSMQGSEPHPTEAVIDYFANKARGGAACVAASGAGLFPIEGDRTGHATWDVYSAPNLHYLARMADRIHFYGAKASMELGPAGIVGVGNVYGASDGIELMDGTIAREMPEHEMDRIADAYAAAADGIRSAGFDVLLLHFGHGLLVGQFLSPLTNKRKDAYGGSLENRARFPTKIIDRIRERVGRRLLVEVRISGSEVIPGGIGVEEAIGFARLIEDRIDLIQVSAGIHNPRYMTVVHPCGFLPPMPNVKYAEAVKKAGVKVPVAAIGGIQDLAQAELVLAEGRADVVAVARGWIADPELAEKAYEGRGGDVRPCVKCMRCHDGAVYENRFACTVNPRIGLEDALPSMIALPSRRKRVAVIGGGPAGMQAALVASERGHEVVLLEKDDALGGTLRFSEKVEFKRDLRRFKDWLAYQVTKSGIELRLGARATPELIGELGADIVVAAVGAEPIVPRIPGMDGRNVVMALRSYGMEEEIGEEVVVIGGGQVGCETALHLAKLGRKVAVIEMQGAMAPDASPTHRTELLYELEDCGRVSLVASARCERIDRSGVAYRDAGGAERSVRADTVVVAVGMRSREGEAESFRGAAPRFVTVGDCVRPATVEQAIRGAFAAASLI